LIDFVVHMITLMFLVCFLSTDALNSSRSQFCWLYI